ncbi:MAG: WYL domain-containing protein [Leadbetterella sp.]|jgi:predicted DNA-binding transcriptional regulator YafY|nr:WYL domain-containing protein [Leadbetterella sp.]
MALTKKPFARYKLIDQHLKRNRGLSIRDLTELVNEELRLLESDDNSGKSIKYQVSERMIRNDIEDMQDIFPVGIIKRNGKYYYEEHTDSIDNINLTEQDKTSISLALNVFSRFKGTPLFDKFSDAITRIISNSVLRKINTTDTAKYIQLADANAASGIEWVEQVYNAIVEKRAISLHYKNFGEKESVKVLSPYMLKEYRNKWYMLAYSAGKEKPGITLPYRLSRIINIDETDESFVEDKEFDGNKYFKYAIGVLPKHNEEPINVKLKVTGKGMIKLISEDKVHNTQEIIPISAEEIHVELRVYNTSELETFILSYGEYIQVLEPVVLREKILGRISKSISKYSLK